MTAFAPIGHPVTVCVPGISKIRPRFGEGCSIFEARACSVRLSPNGSATHFVPRTAPGRQHDSGCVKHVARKPLDDDTSAGVQAPSTRHQPLRLG
jgi:hypothetical protein